MSVPRTDPVAYWWGAVLKMSDGMAPHVPVGELRHLIEMAREAVAMCNTEPDVCGWVGWKVECVGGRCPQCGETITTAGPGTVKAWRSLVEEADDLDDSAAEPLRMAGVDGDPDEA